MNCPASNRASHSRSETTCSKASRRSTARSSSRFSARGDTLREQALKILNTVSPVRGVARAFIDRYGQVPQLQIEVDRAKAARYGLKVADIQDVIETALGGKQATEIWEGEKKFAVVVRLPEEQRRMDNI